MKIWESAHFPDFFVKNSKKPPRMIKRSTIIFNEGDPLDRLYLIKDGFVKLYRLSEEGKETITYLCGPGYILGVRALLSKDESAKHNAEALTDVEVITISRREYFDALAKHPEYILDLIHVFIDRLTYTEAKLQLFILGDSTARVAHFLLDSCMRFGKEKDGKIILPFTLTHQRISEFVGAFRETVTLAMHRLEKDEVLKIQKGKIIITDSKKLKVLALVGS